MQKVLPPVYVCCASRFMEINLEPLLALYPDIRTVVVVRGVHSPVSEADERETLRPSLSARELLKQQGIDVEELDVSPDDVTAVRDLLKHHLRSGWQDRDVLVNVTGGTKAMALGSLTGALDAAPGRTRAFLYFSDPWPRVKVFVGGDAETPLPRPALSLDQMLALRGYRILNGEASRAAEERALVRRRLTEWLYQIATTAEGAADTACSVLNNLAKAAGSLDRNRAFPREIPREKVDETVDGTDPNSLIADNRWKFWSRLVTAPDLATVLDLSSDDAAVVATEDALRYLGGGWLEEAVWLIARKALSEQQGAEVRLGPHLGLISRQTGRRSDDVRDCDVLVVAAGRLHVLECKTAVYGAEDRNSPNGGIGQKEINTLADIRLSLTGPYGTVAILNPRLPRRWNDHAATVMQHAREKGIQTWLGRDMDGQLRTALKAALQPAHSGSGLAR